MVEKLGVFARQGHGVARHSLHASRKSFGVVCMGIGESSAVESAALFCPAVLIAFYTVEILFRKAGLGSPFAQEVHVFLIHFICFYRVAKLMHNQGGAHGLHAAGSQAHTSVERVACMVRAIWCHANIEMNILIERLIYNTLHLIEAFTNIFIYLLFIYCYTISTKRRDRYTSSIALRY